MMKKLILFLSITSVCFSFNLSRVKKYTPPGTVQITENFFADETEISNFSWQEYEFWTKEKYGKDSKEYLAVLPDTLVWRQKISNNESYVNYYYRHSAYKNHPVVGISYLQAVQFCQWRTDRVQEAYYIANKKAVNIKYRLPGKKEWEAISNNETGVFANGGKNKKGEAMFNYRFMTSSESEDYFKQHKKYPDVTTPVNSFSKNRFGLFCSFGNVAEMVAEKGISKGGSWYNTLEECRPGNEIPYMEPTAWLGFRCVCNIKCDL